VLVDVVIVEMQHREPLRLEPSCRKAQHNRNEGPVNRPLIRVLPGGWRRSGVGEIDAQAAGVGGGRKLRLQRATSWAASSNSSGADRVARPRRGWIVVCVV
jgi:hypothetical protein